LEEAGLGELVEVEGRDRARELELLGGIVARQPAALAHEPEEGASHGLIERRDAADAVLDVVGHATSLKDNGLDESQIRF
jgi:hypothetical protein